MSCPYQIGTKECFPCSSLINREHSVIKEFIKEIIFSIYFPMWFGKHVCCVSVSHKLWDIGNPCCNFHSFNFGKHTIQCSSSRSLLFVALKSCPLQGWICSTRLLHFECPYFPIMASETDFQKGKTKWGRREEDNIYKGMHMSCLCSAFT